MNTSQPRIAFSAPTFPPVCACRIPSDRPSLKSANGSVGLHFGIRLANEFKMVVLEIVVGFLLVVWHYSFPSLRALTLGFALVVVFSPLLSFVAFSNFALWINFVPIIFAVALHSWTNLAEENRELRIQVEHLTQLDRDLDKAKLRIP